MSTEDKIKYIDSKLPGLGFCRSHYLVDLSDGAVAFTSRLFEKGVITLEESNKLKLFRTNLFDHTYLNKKLTSQSILFVNIIYNILIKYNHETKETQKTRG
jgi:hypothetical protein